MDEPKFHHGSDESRAFVGALLKRHANGSVCENVIDHCTHPAVWAVRVWIKDDLKSSIARKIADKMFLQGINVPNSTREEREWTINLEKKGHLLCHHCVGETLISLKDRAYLVIEEVPQFFHPDNDDELVSAIDTFLISNPEYRECARKAQTIKKKLVIASMGSVIQQVIQNALGDSANIDENFAGGAIQINPMTGEMRMRPLTAEEAEDAKRSMRKKTERTSLPDTKDVRKMLFEHDTLEELGLHIDPKSKQN